MKLDPWLVYKRLGWRPHKAQRSVLASPARHKVVCGGRRTGKSAIGGHELVPWALVAHDNASSLKEANRRMEYWIVGPNFSDAEKEFRVLWNSVKALGIDMDKPGSYNNPESGFMHMSLWGGAYQVHAKSAMHPEQLVGEGLHGVIMAEAAKMKSIVWTKYIRPTLADYGGWSIHSSTPEGNNWFHDNWQRGLDPALTDWASWRVPSWHNPYVYKERTTDKDVKRLQLMLEMNSASLDIRTIDQLCDDNGLQVDPEIRMLMQDLTGEAFNQEIAADFTEFVGKVFKDFDEETHVFDLQFDPKWQTYAAVDYGFTNPSVWLLIQVGPWGEVHVLDEIYESGLTAPDFAQEIKDRGLCPKGLIRFYADPADPGSTRILSEALKVRNGGNTGGALPPRIDAIRRAVIRQPKHLADDHPEKLPQLRIDRRCKHTIYEMGAYRYPEKRETVLGDAAPENPMKKDDHAPEALGRFFAGHFGTPQNANVGRQSTPAFGAGTREGGARPPGR